MSEIPPPAADNFPAIFEAAFARLQVRVEEAHASSEHWPEQIAAAIRAGFEFAAENPATANVLTNEALAHGADGMARHRRLVRYAAGLLEPGREERSASTQLPTSMELALAGGVIMLVAQRLDQDRAAELPALASEAIEFVLTPYLGAMRAKQAAAPK